MIDTPQLVQSPAQQAAVIKMRIPRSQIQQVMGPGFGELMGAVASQGIGPAGPLYSYHFQMLPDEFDFEIGVPVTGPVKPTGRVQAGELPAAKVARTVYHGPYEGLGAGWGEFGEWVKGQGLKTGPSFWEVYALGPESSPNPADWRTELNRPLA